MKKLICIVLLLVMITSLCTGCGEKDRLLYKDIKLSKCVELAEYKGLKVDTSSSEFTTINDSLINDDITENNFFVVNKEGFVANGDTANIDYVGKKDGVAFEGGTAQGYDLVIGSNSFIDGFESGLIGAEIGKTIDLNLKFPENYQSEELAGADVVFTVTVNYVTTNIALTPEEFYKDLGFESVAEYREDVKQRAIETYLLDKITSECVINEYPQEDIDYIYETYKTSITAQVGVDFVTYISYYGYTEETFKESFIDEQIKPMMKNQMVLYAIFDKEKLSFTSEEIDEEIKKTIAEGGDPSVTKEEIKKLYGEFIFEENVIREKVLKVILDNTKIS